VLYKKLKDIDVIRTLGEGDPAPHSMGRMENSSRSRWLLHGSNSTVAQYVIIASYILCTVLY
jgi:hypothetical protein